VKSYEAAREHADLDSEVERLRAQVRLSWNEESRALQAFGLRDGMSIVDLGSGAGFALARLLESHPSSRITGVELDSALHALAQASLEASPRLALLNRSALDTGLPDDTVDFVIARFLYQHLADPISAAKEAHRILKPGGRLVVIDVALNYRCTSCHTIAYAWQYNMTVDDPTAVPADVNQLMARWKAELANIKTQSVTLTQAINRMNAVIGQFQSLAAYLDLKQDQTTDTTSPNASPPPAASPAAGTSPTAGPAATASPTASPQPSASSSP